MKSSAGAIGKKVGWGLISFDLYGYQYITIIQNKVVEIPPGGSGASDDTGDVASARTQSLCIPTTDECKKFKEILLHKVGFECPYHLMVSQPLNLHSLNDKVSFAGLRHLPKCSDKKPTATTKVTSIGTKKFNNVRIPKMKIVTNLSLFMVHCTMHNVYII